MDKPSSQFIVSIETECLTAVPADPEATGRIMARFLERLGRETPSLKGTAGMFNGYAKVYCDCGHVEIAVVECDSPYTVPLIFERLQILAARVVAELAADAGWQGVEWTNLSAGIVALHRATKPVG